MQIDQTGSENVKIAVVVGGDAPELEHFAAAQLCDYLEKLFGIRTCPTSSATAEADVLFLIGSSDTNLAVKCATEGAPFPQVSEQGLVLCHVQFQERPSVLVGGGSPRTML